jgi:hypothetical protein
MTFSSSRSIIPSAPTNKNLQIRIASTNYCIVSSCLFVLMLCNEIFPPTMATSAKEQLFCLFIGRLMRLKLYILLKQRQICASVSMSGAFMRREIRC